MAMHTAEIRYIATVRRSIARKRRDRRGRFLPKKIVYETILLPPASYEVTRVETSRLKQQVNTLVMNLLEV